MDYFETLEIRLPKATVKRLRLKAIVSESSISTLIREAINVFLAQDDQEARRL